MVILMKKFRKIKRLGHRSTNGILEEGGLIILEKIDGNNVRVTYDDEHEKLLFGSRNVEFKEDGVPFDHDSDEIGGQFEDVTDYIHNTIEEEEKLSDITLFGENMVKHTLEYNWDEAPQWLVFAAFDEEEKTWLPWSEVVDIAHDLGFETVPVVDRMDPETFKEAFDPDDPDDFVPESEYRPGLAEGVVIRNTENDMMAKIRTEEFKEKHDTDGSKKKPKTPNDTNDLINEYATDGRIRKHIEKLVVDQGEDLEMELMEQLPMNVVEDIFEEEYEEIVRTNKTINFKDFRSGVADRCVTLLKKRIREKAMDE